MQIARVLNFNKVIDLITCPDICVRKNAQNEEVEVVLQIKLAREQKEQVLNLVFGRDDMEILKK